MNLHFFICLEYLHLTYKYTEYTIDLMKSNSHLYNPSPTSERAPNFAVPLKNSAKFGARSDV